MPTIVVEVTTSSDIEVIDSGDVVLLSDWYDEVLPEIPGAPPLTLVSNAIRGAAREFCQRTMIWRARTVTLTISSSSATYAFALGTSTALAEVAEVWLDNKTLLKPIIPGDVDKQFPNWRTEVSTPERFWLDGDRSIVFVPIPDAAGEIDMELALKPSTTGTDVPSVLKSRYFEEIGYGAKYRLMRMKKKPWSDADNASLYFNLFENAIGDGKMFATKGGTRGPVRTTVYHSIPLEADS